MGENSAIGWTDHTFNPWLGCTKVSPACQHCYAEAWAKRSGLVKWGDSAERRRTSASYWRQPLKWNKEAMIEGKRRRVFCASLADVFEDRPELELWRGQLVSLIRETPRLDWLLLTKRPENVPSFLIGAGWTFNLRSRLWIGTTVETQDYSKRIDDLAECGSFARVLFLSCEPLLGELDLWPWLFTKQIDWVIVGGESGSQHRPITISYVERIRSQCQTAGVPFFFKQHGGRTPDAGGCLLDGREWKEFPKAA